MIIYQPVDRSCQAPIKNIDKLIDLDKIWISLVFLMGAFTFLNIFLERKPPVKGGLVNCNEKENFFIFVVVYTCFERSYCSNSSC